MQETDEQLYRNFCLNKEEKYLRELLERHQNSLTLFLYSYVRNMEDAEDLMIDVFAAIVSETARYSERKDACFRTWLFAVGRNKARMFLRKNKAIFEPLDENTGVSESSPELDLLIEERNRQLYTGLSMLKPDYARVLYLTYFEEMSPQEVSRVIGTNIKKVYNLLSRGRTALRETMERMGMDAAQYG